MNLLEMVMKNPQLIGQVAKQFGIGEGDATSAMGSLLPSILRGVQNNTKKRDGLGSLMDVLRQGSHSRYVDDPTNLGQPGVIEDGNGMLGHIFGSKDVSRNVAAEAAQKTGLDFSLLKKMLPILAPIVMGMLSKSNSGGMFGGSKSGGGLLGSILGGLLGGNKRRNRQTDSSILTDFLDSDGDGSAIDDILSMATKLI